MGQDAEIGFVNELFVNCFQIIIHGRADTRAGSEKVFGNIHFPVEILVGDGFAVLINKGEGLDFRDDDGGAEPFLYYEEEHNHEDHEKHGIELPFL